MRGAIVLFLMLTFQVLVAQDSLYKKIIYDDFLLLNNTYNNVFFQVPHSPVSDSVNYNIYVDIIEVDTIRHNLFAIKVKFNVLTNLPYWAIRDSSFSYVVYKTNNKIFKINGFMYSEILETANLGWQYMSKLELKKIFFSKPKKRKIFKFIQYNDADRMNIPTNISFKTCVNLYLQCE
jgi:hypothetical protein